MRSLTARLFLIAVASLASAGATFYLFRTERPIAERRAGIAAFDRTARSAMLSLEGARAAQLAYVAEGQGSAIWQPTVAAALSEVPGEVDSLRALSADVDARAMLVEAAARLRSFADVDTRALEYLDAGETLMASDLVFTEGAQAVAAAIELVDSAWRREIESLGAAERAHRLTSAYIAGGGAGFLLLLLFVLAMPAPPAARATGQEPRGASDSAPGLDLRFRHTETALEETAAAADASAGRAPDVASPAPERVATPPQAPDVPPAAAAPAVAQDTAVREPARPHIMRTAADICMSLGAVRDAEELRALLARAAALLEAAGLIVWVGDAGGADLRASVAHGYSAQALARMPAIGHGANNAVAAAYRSGMLQVVPAEGRTGAGAVIAPLLTPEGCVGALTADVASGREDDETIHALALLFAAQLSAILAADAAPPAAAAPSDSRAATA